MKVIKLSTKKFKYLSLNILMNGYKKTIIKMTNFTLKQTLNNKIKANLSTNNLDKLIQILKICHKIKNHNQYID